MRGSLRLRLYIAGSAPNSVDAQTNLERLLRGQEVELEVVDVLEHPERAGEDGVIVTPMLIRLTPAPRRQLVGSLHDLETVARRLGLEAEEA